MGSPGSLGVRGLILLLGICLFGCQKKPPASLDPSVVGLVHNTTPISKAVEPLTNSGDPKEEAPDPIGDVLATDLAPGETSSRLLALLPSTAVDDRAFLVQLAGNYCPDEEYWCLLPSLLDRTLPEDCREELLNDVLRRPDHVRLRPLYRLAIDPTHPLSAEAREYLFSYFPDVPDNDFPALARAVDQAEREAP